MSLTNKDINTALLKKLRVHAALLNRELKVIEPLPELDIQTNDPSEMNDEMQAYAERAARYPTEAAEAYKHNAGMVVSSYSCPTTITAQLKGTASISSIGNLIKEIREKIPLVRREDGSPDVVGVCRAIKEYNSELWDKTVIYSLISRSAWGTRLTRCAEFASFTPIILAAYKPVARFSEWDTEANFAAPTAMYICLGTALGNIMYSKPPKDYKIFSDTFLSAYRVNEAKKPRYLNEEAFEDFEIPCSYYRPDLKMSKNGVKDYLHMLTQTWICQPSIRNPETMILDIYDWDLVPEPLVPEVEEVAVIPDDWDDI